MTPEDRARRERIATACLQGLLADGCPLYPKADQTAQVAKSALAYADALIAQLDRPPDPFVKLTDDQARELCGSGIASLGPVSVCRSVLEKRAPHMLDQEGGGK
jgi:hypothetical protein